MPKTIVINSSNYVQNSGNKYVYNFPKQIISSIGVSQIAMYNSIRNITESRGNNKITLNWLGEIYNITIPNGYYSVSEIN
jgi:hypothetical protein